MDISATKDTTHIKHDKSYFTYWHSAYLTNTIFHTQFNLEGNNSFLKVIFELKKARATITRLSWHVWKYHRDHLVAIWNTTKQNCRRIGTASKSFVERAHEPILYKKKPIITQIHFKIYFVVIPSMTVISLRIFARPTTV